MARQPVQWRRIYRQTRTLMHRNVLIFYTSPIATAVRALFIPLAVTLVLCYLKYIQAVSDGTTDYGIATVSTPVRNLADAMNGVSSYKIVFVRNGSSIETITPIIDGIAKLPGMDRMKLPMVDSPDDLFVSCQQNLQGRSDCYAAVTFSTVNKTHVNYNIVLDGSIGDKGGYGNWRKGENNLMDRVFPLQWALNAQIGGFVSTQKPMTQAFAGSFGPNRRFYDAAEFGFVSDPAVFWVSMVSLFIGPLFCLITIGVIYHLATFVARERESSMAELMAAQEVTLTPRILSTFLSFFALYAPGLLFSSIIMTQVLFTKTSDILMIVLTLLAGTSFITASHFLGSFFGKASLAGLYSSTLAFALSFITLTATLTIKDIKVQVGALAAIFPPCTWATLIEDIALRETAQKPFSLLPKIRDPLKPLTKVQFLDGYLYIVFFVMQIVLYSLGTYLVERTLWGVTRKYDRIPADSDVAVRVTGLTKTYFGKRRWYWPFSRKGKTVVAANSLNLEVKKGSVTFLLGPNGGGKTTTLKCIAGMVSMDKGSRLELNEAGLVFGICPQANVFWPGLTVRQHIKIWRELKTAANDDISSDDDDDVISECDLIEKTNARSLDRSSQHDGQGIEDAMFLIWRTTSDKQLTRTIPTPNECR